MFSLVAFVCCVLAFFAEPADSAFLQQSGHSFLQECPKLAPKPNVQDAIPKGTAEEHESG